MTAIPRRKRLIEVAFPLEEVSAHSRPEKYAPPGHISTLHGWWARRPLAACRAFIYASLVYDPGTDAQREDLLKEVADLASWDAVRHPDRVVRAKSDGGSGFTGSELLERARKRILDDNGGAPPKPKFTERDVAMPRRHGMRGFGPRPGGMIRPKPAGKWAEKP